MKKRKESIRIQLDLIPLIISFLPFEQYLQCRLVHSTWNALVISANEGLTMTIKREIFEDEWDIDGDENCIDWKRIAHRCKTLELIGFNEGFVDYICDATKAKKLLKLLVKGALCVESLICIIGVRKPKIIELDRMELLTFDMVISEENEDQRLHFERFSIVGPCNWAKPCRDSRISCDLLILKHVDFSILDSDDNYIEEEEEGEDDMSEFQIEGEYGPRVERMVVVGPITVTDKVQTTVTDKVQTTVIDKVQTTVTDKVIKELNKSFSIFNEIEFQLCTINLEEEVSVGLDLKFSSCSLQVHKVNANQVLLRDCLLKITGDDGEIRAEENIIMEINRKQRGFYKSVRLLDRFSCRVFSLRLSDLVKFNSLKYIMKIPFDCFDVIEVGLFTKFCDASHFINGVFGNALENLSSRIRSLKIYLPKGVLTKSSRKQLVKLAKSSEILPNITSIKIVEI